jgi:adenine C2-methylase RlmN of 23S rRNA A2503 and tRNA A37
VRAEAPGIVTGAVFQGQGEPLLTDEVMRAAESQRSVRRMHYVEAITISTVGLVPAIRRFTRRRVLSIDRSLTSAIDARRRARTARGGLAGVGLASAIRGFNARADA